MYIVNLIRERASEQEIYVDTFHVNDSVKDPEKALRDAVKEFLNTGEGIRSVSYTSNDFNWGDAINDVPDRIWAKHGLKFCSVNAVNIKVDQDEILCNQ